MSTGLVDIYKVKRSQRHLLATIENNKLVSPIDSKLLLANINNEEKAHS